MPTRAYQVIEYVLFFAVAIDLSFQAPWMVERMYKLPISAWVLETSLPILTIVLLYVHHWREQLIPLYGALATSFFHRCMLYFPSSTGTGPRYTITGSFSSAMWYIAAVGLCASLILTLLFPLPDFTKLHGEYLTIGGLSARIGGVDCRVFYPSAKAANSVPPKQRMPYLHHGEHLGKGISIFSKVPEAAFRNFQNGYLSAIPDAVLADSKEVGKSDGWPVIVFSHGLAGSLELYSTVNQELASAGFVVIVVNHNDGSASVANVLNSDMKEEIRYYDKIPAEVWEKGTEALMDFRRDQLRHRVSEMKAVVDALFSQKDDGSRLAQVLLSCDKNKVNLVGHSFGAATTLTTAHQDDRYQTVVLLDAWLEPVDESVKVSSTSTNVPMLHLISDQFAAWKPNFEDMKKHSASNKNHRSRLMQVRGSRHNNFCDLPLFSPFISKISKVSGPIDPVVALEIIGRLSATFVQGEQAFVDTLSGYPQTFTPAE